MRDDFRVSFSGELVPFLSELLLQAVIVLHDPVVHNHNFAGAIAMRMGVFFGGTAVRSPSGVAYAVRAMEWLLPNRFFQIPQFSFGTANLKTTSVAGYCDSCGIVAAIFQPPQTFNDDRNNTFLANVTDDATHFRPRRPGLFSQRETELFDDRIGQDLAGDTFDFGLGLFPTQASVQRELEILSLPDALQALAAHLLERAVNRFALGVENTLLERNVDVGCHTLIIIRDL